jgi:hypothetical protein
MVEAETQHKAEQREEAIVVHHKQQRLKYGVLNHQNPPLEVAMEVVERFGVLATRVALKNWHHILHQVAALEGIALSLLVAEDIKVVLFISFSLEFYFNLEFRV